MPPSRAKSALGSPGDGKSDTRSLSSQQSIGLDGASPFGGAGAYISRMYDIVQIALLCRQHRALLLSKMPNCSELYFPFACLKPGESAPSAQQSKLRDLLGALSLSKSSLSEAILVDLLRIEIPPNNEYLIRYTFRLEEKREGGVCLCSGLKSPVDAFEWLQYESDGKSFKSSALAKLWAIEPALMLDKILNSPHPKEEVLQEITLTEVTKYLSDEVKIGHNQLSSLLGKLKYSADDLYRAFLEYLQHTYPSIYLNKTFLGEFLNNNPILPAVYEPKALLGAFQIDPTKDSSLGYIDFEEFLWGLLFLDIDCKHETPFSDIRTSYAFRYYASLSKNRATLEFDELTKMAADTEQVHYRAMTSPDQRKQRDAEVETFWKEAGVGGRGKGAGLNYAKFNATVEKMSSKSPRFLNMDMVLRGVKPLQYCLNGTDILSRGTNLGRDVLDIVRKRENVCPGCVTKEPVKLAEHTVKVFYNGSITEVWENEKWIPDLKREKDKAKRRASKNLFNDDYFPNVLLEALGASVENGAPPRSATKATLNTKAEGKEVKAPKSSVKWSAKFVQKNLTKILDIVGEAEGHLEGDLVRVKSPVSVVPDLSGKLADPFTIERNMSHLMTLCFPMRYVYMLTLGDFAKNGLELLLFLVANKCLLADKYFPILGKIDAKKREQLRTHLSKQCDAVLGKEEASKLLTGLLRLAEKLPKVALIDEAVYVVAGVESGDAEGSLRQVLANYETPGVGGKGGGKKRRGRKGKGKVSSPAAASAVSVVGPSELSVAPGMASSGPGPNSTGCFVLYTTAESVSRKLLYVRMPDEPAAAPVVLGKDKAMPANVAKAERLMVILVESDKIRPIYLLPGKE